jgi:predicted PurR-regulated permease PerM
MNRVSFRSIFLLVLVGGVTVAFAAMLRPFLLTILLAAVFTGVTYPGYRRILHAFGGRAGLAAVATLLLLFVLVMGPLLAVLAAAANEALRISETIGPRLQQFLKNPGEIEERLALLPGYDFVAPYRADILTRVGDLVSGTGVFLFNALSATTRATVLFAFHLVVLLYTMFFFLMSGPRMLQAMAEHLPLTDVEKQRMFERFISVTRATLKGTVLIGMTQGTLGGLSFWAIGIDGPIFWGVVMTVLSIIPGVGGAIIWLPATLVLLAQGEVWRAVGLAAFNALVVGSVDNVLRPRLVGRDTQMHDLLIFFSTLGGLLLFGASGFIVGPILAALFLTVWDMIATASRQGGAARSSDLGA